VTWPPPVKHGLSGGRQRVGRHPAYARWINIRQRCTNPNHPRFHDYGGRRTYLCPDGIWFAEEWSDFARFVADVGEPPGRRYDLYSIDRINNDGPYAPGNVRWSTAAQQRANTYREPWPFGVLVKDGEGDGEGVEALMASICAELRADEILQAAVAARDWGAAIERGDQLRAMSQARPSERSEG
jgi:hypothetical protein